MKKLESLKK
jgi:chromosome segregation ATPase